MNTAQLVSLLRILILFGGGIAVGRGWLTQDQVDTLSDPAMLIAVAGGLSAAGAAGWAIWTRRNKALVAAAAGVDGVEKIVARQDIADAIPSPKVQPRERKDSREPLPSRPTSGRPAMPPEPMTDR